MPAQDHVGVARRAAPLSPDELWRAYLARFDEEHTYRFPKKSREQGTPHSREGHGLKTKLRA